jgi:excinuclease ABC subunit B
VLLYADKQTDSLTGAIAEMDRRRAKQLAYNQQHGVVPRTIQKPIRDLMEAVLGDDEANTPGTQAGGKRGGKGGGKRGRSGKQAAAGEVLPRPQFQSHLELLQHQKLLRQEMLAAAKNLDFELAAKLRDEVFRLEKLGMELQ